MADKKGKKGKKKGKGGGGGLNRLLDPGKDLKGKDLKRLAKALTKLEIKPQTGAYKRLAEEIGRQEEADISGLGRLGRETSRKTGAAFRGFDVGASQGNVRAAAIGNMLNQSNLQAGQAASAEQQGVQTGQLGGMQEAMALRGAPGGGQAQQQLADLVSQQASRRAGESQAASQFGASQGAAFTGLASGARTAGALQGATAQGDIGRSTASRIAQTRLEAGADKREALGKLADVKALRGPTMLKNLMEVRDRSVETALSKAGLNLDKKELASEEREAALERQHESAESRRERRHETRESRKDRRADRGDEEEGEGKGKQKAKAARNAAIDIVNQVGVDEAKKNLAGLIDKIMEQVDVGYNQARKAALRAIRRAR